MLAFLFSVMRVRDVIVIRNYVERSRFCPDENFLLAFLILKHPGYAHEMGILNDKLTQRYLNMCIVLLCHICKH